MSVAESRSAYEENVELLRIAQSVAVGVNKSHAHDLLSGFESDLL